MVPRLTKRDLEKHKFDFRMRVVVLLIIAGLISFLVLQKSPYLDTMQNLIWFLAGGASMGGNFSGLGPKPKP